MLTCFAAASYDAKSEVDYRLCGFPNRNGSKSARAKQSMVYNTIVFIIAIVLSTSNTLRTIVSLQKVPVIMTQ